MRLDAATGNFLSLVEEGTGCGKLKGRILHGLHEAIP
jgi:hypothetical protein